MPKKKENLSPEERLAKAIIPKEEEPYKLPDNWVWIRLGEVANILNGDRGKNYPAKNKLSEKGEIPFISASNLENGKILTENLLFLSNEQYEKLKAGKIQENDLLFCIRGSLGKYGKNYFSQGAIASSLVIVRSILGNQKIVEYIENYFKTILLKNEILKYNNGTAQPNLSAENFKKFLFPLPPLNEQKRIVEKLDSLFEKTGRIKEIIEEVKEKTSLRREAVLLKAFTGELTEKWRAENKTENAKELLLKINDEKLKIWEDECKRAEEDGRKKPSKPKLNSVDEMIIPEDEKPYKVPDNWVWTRLENIITLLSGQDISSKLCNSDKIGIPYILGASNIENNIFTAERWIESPKVISLKNDLLLSVKGTIGKLYLQKEDKINISRQIMALRPYIYCLEVIYLKYFLEHNVESLKNEGNGLIPGISRDVVLNKKISLPPLEEQKEIVRILDKVFEEENRISELISLEEKVEILEKTILDKAFRGELGTGNIDDEPALELLKKVIK